MTQASPDCERLGLAAAVKRLEAGGLIAYPTETVWGLGANAACPEAVERLRAWKGREADRPLAVLTADALAAFLPPDAARLAESFWPGPLTLVAPGRTQLAPGVAREDGAIGWRCSPHPVATALARAAEAAGLGPITATSLNRSGEPPARTRDEAVALCTGEGAPAVVSEGPDAGASDPSTVVDVSGAEPKVLREGAIPADRILEARQQWLRERRCA